MLLTRLMLIATSAQLELRKTNRKACDMRRLYYFPLFYTHASLQLCWQRMDVYKPQGIMDYAREHMSFFPSCHGIWYIQKRCVWQSLLYYFSSTWTSYSFNLKCCQQHMLWVTWCEYIFWEKVENRFNCSNFT